MRKQYIVYIVYMLCSAAQVTRCAPGMILLSSGRALDILLGAHSNKKPPRLADKVSPTAVQQLKVSAVRLIL